MQVGDKVKVIRKFAGYPNWVPEMDITIGRVFKIVNVFPATSDSPKYYELSTAELTEKQNYNYAEEVLEPVNYTPQDFIVGQKARVVKKVEYPFGWTPEMVLGKKFNILNSGRGVQLNTASVCGNAYYFSPDALEPVDLWPLATTGCARKYTSKDFKVGAKARVVAKYDESGSSVHWNAHFMDPTIGKEFKIMDVSNDWVRLVVDDVSGLKPFLYPIETLEPVQMEAVNPIISPFFKKGDKVRILTHKMFGSVREVLEVSTEFPGSYKLESSPPPGSIGGIWYQHKDLELVVKPMFKAGDRVKVVKNGYPAEGIDRTVGRAGLVVSHEPNGNSFRYRVYVDGQHAWTYDETCLDFEEASARKPVLPKFKVGDKVKIARFLDKYLENARRIRAGGFIPYGWVGPLDATVGKVGVVTYFEIQKDSVFLYTVEIEGTLRQFLYCEESLEKQSEVESKPMNGPKFKVGQSVKIECVGPGWLSAGMGKTIGCIGEIVGHTVASRGSGIEGCSISPHYYNVKNADPDLNWCYHESSLAVTPRFKVGEKVKITRRVSDRTDGEGRWNLNMEKTLSQTGTVVSVKILSDARAGGFDFVYVVEVDGITIYANGKPLAPRHTYQEECLSHQECLDKVEAKQIQSAKPKFSIGDKVNIVRDISKEEQEAVRKQFGFIPPNLHATVGKVAEIKTILPKWACGFVYSVQVESDKSWYCIENCLELVDAWKHATVIFNAPQEEATPCFVKAPDLVGQVLLDKCETIKRVPVETPRAISINMLPHDSIDSIKPIDLTSKPIDLTSLDSIKIPSISLQESEAKVKKEPRNWDGFLLVWGVILFVSISLASVFARYLAPSNKINLETLNKAVEEFPELRPLVRESLLDGEISGEEWGQIDAKLNQLRLEQIKKLVIE